jgi:hypothetical protein
LHINDDNPATSETPLPRNTRYVDSDTIDSDLEKYLAHILDYFEFTEEDNQLVRESGDALRQNITRLMDDFYAKQLGYSTTARFLLNPDGTQKPEFKRAREGITNFLLGMADGKIDLEFAKRAERIGDAHTRLKLDIRYMVGATSFFKVKIAGYVREK